MVARSVFNERLVKAATYQILIVKNYNLLILNGTPSVQFFFHILIVYTLKNNIVNFQSQLVIIELQPFKA